MLGLMWRQSISKGTGGGNRELVHSSVSVNFRKKATNNSFAIPHEKGRGGPPPEGGRGGGGNERGRTNIGKFLEVKKVGKAGVDDMVTGAGVWAVSGSRKSGGQPNTQVDHEERIR